MCDLELFLLHFLEIRQYPATIEEWFGGRIKPEVREPALTGNGLDPVFFLALRRVRSDVDGTARRDNVGLSVIDR